MSRLWTPPKVRQRDRENTAQFAAAIRAATFEDAICEKWNRELIRLDPLLRMVKNRSDDQWVVGTPLVPGAYHLLRVNENAPMTVIPLIDGDGRALPEPPGRTLEDLKEMDLQNVRATEIKRKIREEQARRDAQARELEREQRREQILDHWKKVSNASVSMNRDTPWSQNNSPAARRDRAAKKTKG